MKLWMESDAGSAGTQVRTAVKEMAADIDRKILSRGVRVVNAMRNAELEVLNGQRSGKKYRKYPYKSMYTASAPGEVPARRSGNLRMHWCGQVKKKSSSVVVAELESGEEYADYLQNGKGMAPRPFTEKILEKAKPEADRILSESYR